MYDQNDDFLVFLIRNLYSEQKRIYIPYRFPAILAVRTIFNSQYSTSQQQLSEFLSK